MILSHPTDSLSLIASSVQRSHIFGRSPKPLQPGPLCKCSGGFHARENCTRLQPNNAIRATENSPIAKNARMRGGDDPGENSPGFWLPPPPLLVLVVAAEEDVELDILSKSSCINNQQVCEHRLNFREFELRDVLKRTSGEQEAVGIFKSFRRPGSMCAVTPVSIHPYSRRPSSIRPTQIRHKCD